MNNCWNRVFSLFLEKAHSLVMFIVKPSNNLRGPPGCRGISPTSYHSFHQPEWCEFPHVLDVFLEKKP